MKIYTAIITGGAGFIGVNLIKSLEDKYEKIVCIDNFSLGNLKFFKQDIKKSKIEILTIDCSDVLNLKKIFYELSQNDNYGDVWHLAANSDIPSGVKNPEIDFKDTFLTTYSLLSAMRDSNFKKIYFASSSAIYGDHKEIRLNERSGPLLPISNYGAMKLSSEAIISAASESFLERAVIFRFPNVVGSPATHGVIYDFTKRLLKDSTKLDVLGDGSQRKSYLHVKDLVQGMIEVSKHWINKKTIDIYNLGPVDNGIYVNEIAEIVCNNFGNKIKINYGISNKGWIGDVPKFYYDINKIKDEIGWKPNMNSREAITKASAEIYEQFINKSNN